MPRRSWRLKGLRWIHTTGWLQTEDEGLTGARIGETEEQANSGRGGGRGKLGGNSGDAGDSGDTRLGGFSGDSRNKGSNSSKILVNVA